MKINLSGFLCSTSYGLVLLNLIKSLTESGHEVSVFPLGGDFQDVPIHFHESVKRSLENSQYWDVNAPSISIVHQNMMHVCVGRKRIGWPIFELDRFNDHELHHLRSLDQIIVCSEWAKEVCRQNGLTQQIDIVPLGVDTSIFFPSNQSRKEGPTVFLSIGKKEVRKLHDQMHTYFEKAFSPSDNVELWMVWGNRILDVQKHQESKAWTETYKKSKMSSRIKLFEWLPSQSDVADLLRRADCYVGLSRAEGWNLNLLEAMATGLTCITNNYSGHTEFIRQDSPYVIPYRASEVAYDGTWFFGQGNWMAFDTQEEELVVEHMRDFHQWVQSFKEPFDSPRNLEIAQKFSWENSATKLIEAVS